MSHETSITRTSDRDIVVTRIVRGAPHRVYAAWTQAEHFRRWWVPRSFGLHLAACELDVRVGGRYRLAFLHEGATLEFFGTYLEVVPHTRLVWTNEEDSAGHTITTVTFEPHDDGTRLVVHDRYPSAEAADANSSGAMPETLDQLEELLAALP